MNTIYDNTFVLGQTSATNFIAGPGIKIDEPSAGTVRIGNDETVLYSGSTTATAALTEDIRNFERVRVAFNHNGNGISEFLVSEISAGDSCPLTVVPTFSNNYASVYSQSWKFPATTSFSTAFKCKEWYGNAGVVSSKDAINHTVVKVWGINRISGGNE